MVALLDTVKKALRVNNAALDEAEIVPLIEAAKKELAIAGVVMIDEDDPMIIRAITTYAKAHFGYDNPEAERFERIFASIRNTLSQLGEYSGDACGGSGGTVDREAIADAVENYFESGAVKISGGEANNGG
jgi:hypothetical protein